MRLNIFAMPEGNFVAWWGSVLEMVKEGDAYFLETCVIMRYERREIMLIFKMELLILQTRYKL